MCAVVSIRCSECGEVKPDDEIEIRGGGNVCHECTRPESVTQAREATEKAEEVQDEPEEEPEEPETEDDDGESEEEEVTAESFQANDALSW